MFLNTSRMTKHTSKKNENEPANCQDAVNHVQCNVLKTTVQIGKQVQTFSLISYVIMKHQNLKPQSHDIRSRQQQ